MYSKELNELIKAMNIMIDAVKNIEESYKNNPDDIENINYATNNYLRKLDSLGLLNNSSIY